MKEEMKKSFCTFIGGIKWSWLLRIIIQGEGGGGFRDKVCNTSGYVGKDVQHIYERGHKWVFLYSISENWVKFIGTCRKRFGFDYQPHWEELWIIIVLFLKIQMIINMSRINAIPRIYTIDTLRHTCAQFYICQSMQLISQLYLMFPMK